MFFSSSEAIEKHTKKIKESASTMIFTGEPCPVYWTPGFICCTYGYAHPAFFLERMLLLVLSEGCLENTQTVWFDQRKRKKSFAWITVAHAIWRTTKNRRERA